MYSYSLSFNALLIEKVSPAVIGKLCEKLQITVSFPRHPVIPRLWEQAIPIPKEGSIVTGEEAALSTLEQAIKRRVEIDGSEVSSSHMTRFMTKEKNLCN